MQELDSYLAERPAASIADVREHFESLRGTAVRFVQARRAGYYGAFRVRSDIAAWLTDVLVDRVQLLPGPAGVAAADPRIAAIVEEADAELLLAGAQLVLRRRQLDEVRRVVENRYSREEALRRVLVSAPWLWGGDFVDVAATRRLVRGKEIDVALVRPGGVLHAVELKRANVRLVKAHRGELVLTSEVHDAVGQMANYLRAFDEPREQDRRRDLREADRGCRAVARCGCLGGS